MAAIDGCLAAGCQALNLDIAELWRRESRTAAKFSCVTVHASSNIVDHYSIVTADDKKAAIHKLSPELCNRALKQKVPLWYTVHDNDALLHPNLPVKTAIVIPTYCYEIQQEFYVVFFAFHRVEVSLIHASFL